MAINASDIIDALKSHLNGFCVRDISMKRNLKDQFSGLPIEVQWPYDEGSGETRRVTKAVIQNSGDPERPCLVLICGLAYSDDPDDMSYFPGQPMENTKLYGPEVDAQAALDDTDLNTGD